jgi:hypothetical protein
MFFSKKKKKKKVFACHTNTLMLSSNVSSQKKTCTHLNVNGVKAHIFRKNTSHHDLILWPRVLKNESQQVYEKNIVRELLDVSS